MAVRFIACSGGPFPTKIFDKSPGFPVGPRALGRLQHICGRDGVPCVHHQPLPPAWKLLQAEPSPALALIWGPYLCASAQRGLQTCVVFLRIDFSGSLRHFASLSEVDCGERGADGLQPAAAWTLAPRSVLLAWPRPPVWPGNLRPSPKASSF